MMKSLHDGSRLKHIACVHLLNDYSGSPLVFSQSLAGLKDSGAQIVLFTSDSEGFLSFIPDVQYRLFSYRWHPNKLFTLWQLIWCQSVLFFKILFAKKRFDVVYVNTILPFGAALAGKLLGAKVVYHMHETSVKPQILKKFLLRILKLCASDVIYVSDFLSKQESVNSARCHTIPNAISENFILKAQDGKKLHSLPYKVLMLCSLKEYKGVSEFIALAEMLPEFQFVLVLNSDPVSINSYMKSLPKMLPLNLKWYPAQKDVHPFFCEADLVLNLSHPDKWIETFGMTVLEAMYYKLPVIVPPVGGIAELVDEGINGFKIDVRALESIRDRIRQVFTDPVLYRQLSTNAEIRSKRYSIAQFHKQVVQVVM